MRTKKILVAATVLFLLAGCGGEEKKISLDSAETVEASAAEDDAAEKREEVNDYAVVQVLEPTGEHRTIGSFVAKELVTVSAKVGGTLIDVPVDTGVEVKATTVVARVDREDYELQLRNVEAQLAVATAGLNNARSEFERKKLLFDDGAIPASTFDLVRTQLELAEAQELSAKVAVEIAEKALRDTVVKAGVKGVVSRRMVSAGEFADSGDALVEVSVVKPIKMMFSVPERLAAEIAEGGEATARLAAYPGRVFRGKVILVSPTIDPATRTVPIEAEFGNADGALKPGFFAECSVELRAGKLYFRVPAEALFGAGGGHEVRVRTPVGVTAVPVILIELQGSRAKIVPEEDGALQGGEQVELRKAAEAPQESDNVSR